MSWFRISNEPSTVSAQKKKIFPLHWPHVSISKNGPPSLTGVHSSIHIRPFWGAEELDLYTISGLVRFGNFAFAENLWENPKRTFPRKHGSSTRHPSQNQLVACLEKKRYYQGIHPSVFHQFPSPTFVRFQTSMNQRWFTYWIHETLKIPWKNHFLNPFFWLSDSTHFCGCVHKINIYI